jgi:hypothetical protein
MSTGQSSNCLKRHPVLLSRHPANNPQVSPITNCKHIPNIVLLFLDTQLTLPYTSPTKKQFLIKNNQTKANLLTFKETLYADQEY